MTEKNIIRAAMKARNINQTILAKDAGYSRQTNVSELLRSQSLRVCAFVRLLNAMNFDVIVVDRNTRSGFKWNVTEKDDEKESAK